MIKLLVLWILILGKMAGAKLISVEFEVFGRVQGKNVHRYNKKISRSEEFHFGGSYAK